MDLALTKQWITRWEGVRTACYKDTKGIATIGVGFNLQTSGAEACIAGLGLDYNQVLTGACDLTPDQIDQLLDTSIQTAIATARRLVPNFDNLPDNQQMVITDLAYNMGPTVLGEFHNTLNFINNQDWPNAAANLQQSAWIHQVGPGPTQRGGADVAVLGNTANPQDILNA
jgi:GH24 family phage-related lysozyme (muramidase)